MEQRYITTALVRERLKQRKQEKVNKFFEDCCWVFIAFFCLYLAAHLITWVVR